LLVDPATWDRLAILLPDEGERSGRDYLVAMCRLCVGKTKVIPFPNLFLQALRILLKDMEVLMRAAAVGEVNVVKKC